MVNHTSTKGSSKTTSCIPRTVVSHHTDPVLGRQVFGHGAESRTQLQTPHARLELEFACHQIHLVDLGLTQIIIIITFFVVGTGIVHADEGNDGSR
jgi:hypothetical protein